MRGLNKAIIAGNLARDPDIRYTVDKRAWARFSVAVNYSFKNRNGEYQESVDFVPVAVWGPMAENCGKYLKKGSQVVVEGRINTRSYDAKDGSGKKYVTEVVANDVIFMGSRDDNGSQSSSQYSQAPYPAANSSSSARPAQPDDMPPFDPFGNDDSFGSSIDDKSFNGDFAPNFNSSQASSSNSNNEAEIPF